MILEKKDRIELDFSAMPSELKPMADQVQQFMEIRNLYHSAIKEISTKLEILDDDFQVKNDYNPIHHMECRVKSIQSTFQKVVKKGYQVTLESIQAITDIAGIRVICNYVDDVYKISELLLRQDDIELIRESDYIAEPKESGYRSLHMVILVPVFLAESTERVPVEVQVRTIAMDTWASLEHELKYKREESLDEHAIKELQECAKDMQKIDERMQQIHKTTTMQSG